MVMRYVQTGNDEDGNPVYDYVDDGVDDELYTEYQDSGDENAEVRYNNSGYQQVGMNPDGSAITVDSDPGVITGPGSVAGSGGGVGAGSAGGIRSGTTGSGTGGARNPFSGNNMMGNLLGALMAYKILNQRRGNVSRTRPVNPNAYTFKQTPIRAAEGGIMGLARGGSAKPPRYLQGATDGMADKLSTSIDGEQAAALSHGEFVVPADVVSHLGNGNSEAGAKQLYKMMDRIRLARTGNKKQGKRINPEKFTPGGIAGYAGGGVVAFATGNLVTTGQGLAGSNPVTSESNLSEWAAPGVVDYIEKGTALANQPYQAYQGPLVAGTSPLQTQAFDTASKLAPSANIGKAATMLDTAGTNLGKLSYNAAPVSSTYTAPAGYTAGQVGNVYTPTAEYTPQSATNQFSGPAAYQAGDFSNQYGGIAAYAPQTATNQFKGPAAYQATKFDSQYEKTDPYAARDVTVDKFNTAAVLLQSEVLATFANMGSYSRAWRLY